MHPDYQGKGLGKMLVQQGLDLADAEGKKTFLSSTEAGYEFYLKLGFKEVDVVKIDVTKWGGKEPVVSQVMLRDPRPL